MRIINKPDLCTVTEVYETCVNGIRDKSLRDAFMKQSNMINNMAKAYDEKANKAELYNFYPDNTKNSFVKFSPITKQQWKSLYSQHMVPSKKKGRHKYDKLMSLAKDGICPFCGFGQVNTLDHFLPKSKYPLLSVLPLNLVASCRDCNSRKGNIVAKKGGEQSLHPYYDHNEITSDQWLYATVRPESPAVVSYYVKPPEKWSKISQKRVEAHFKEYKLASRYSIQAADQLSSTSHLFIKYTKIDIRSTLKESAEVEIGKHINSWKTAFFQALYNSEWYCTEGYKY
jgi:hypothetical protein